MSRSADAAIGMMDQAYFVSRSELLDFFNNLLHLNLAKIEQTASGAVACQLIDYIFPGSVPMSRVNWEARSDYEFIDNYKLLQKAFTKNRIQRHIDVTKLIRAKYQDNLEFCQWLKAFYDQSGVVRDDYDGKAVRAKGKGGKRYDQQQDDTASKTIRRPVSRGRTTHEPTISKPAPPKQVTRIVNRSVSPQKQAPLRENNRTVSKADPELQKKNAELEAKNADLEAKNAEMQEKLTEVETALVDLEKERDFYFGKLRNVELMLQVQQDKNFDGADLDSVVEKIFKVLYATAEEDVDIDEHGEIIPTAESDDPINTTEISNVSIPAKEEEVF